MKKLVLILLGCLLLGGCSRKTEAAVEYVSDEAALQGVYTISFDIPEGVEETALGTSGTLYSDPDGNYTIAAEQIAAKTLEEAVETISGFPYDTLDVIALNGGEFGSYQFAWASAGEEGDSVSACKLYAGDGGYYALTMTQRAGLGTRYASVAEAAFSSFTLHGEEII